MFHSSTEQTPRLNIELGVWETDNSRPIANSLEKRDHRLSGDRHFGGYNNPPSSDQGSVSHIDELNYRLPFPLAITVRIGFALGGQPLVGSLT